MRSCGIREDDPHQDLAGQGEGADASIAELDELEELLTGDSAPLAKAALHRVSESVVLRREQVSPRRREPVRAEITPRFPFGLTVNTSSRAAPGVTEGRVQGRIRNTISTSADAPSGNCAIPSAVRACLPASPSTSSTRLEAPLITRCASVKSGSALT